MQRRIDRDARIRDLSTAIDLKMTEQVGANWRDLIVTNSFPQYSKRQCKVRGVGRRDARAQRLLAAFADVAAGRPGRARFRAAAALNRAIRGTVAGDIALRVSLAARGAAAFRARHVTCAVASAVNDRARVDGEIARAVAVAGHVAVRACRQRALTAARACRAAVRLAGPDAGRLTGAGGRASGAAGRIARVFGLTGVRHAVRRRTARRCSVPDSWSAERARASRFASACGSRTAAVARAGSKRRRSVAASACGGEGEARGNDDESCDQQKRLRRHHDSPLEHGPTAYFSTTTSVS